MGAGQFSFVEISRAASSVSAPTIVGVEGEPNAAAKLWVNDPLCLEGNHIAESVVSSFGTLTWSAFTLSGEGLKEFYYRLWDRKKNGTQCLRLGLSYTLDVTPPAASVVWNLSGPSQNAKSNDTTPSFTFSGAEPQTTLELYSASDCSGLPVAKQQAAAASGTVTGSVSTEGVLSFYYKAVDDALNETPCTATSASFELDTTPPTIAWQTEIADPSYSRTARGEFSGTDGGSGLAGFECSLDGGTFASCSGVYSSAPLLSGMHSLSVRSVDQAGNVSATTLNKSWETIPAQVSDFSVTAHAGCALTNGRIFCWGTNEHASLGDGTTTNRATPVEAQGLGGVAQGVSRMQNSACALVAGGVKCWGQGYWGNLGNGSTANSSVPVNVIGLGSGVSFIRGGIYHQCAVKEGALSCWGDHAFGQLGLGIAPTTTPMPFSSPQPVSGLGNGVEDVMAGSGNTCALRNGQLSCWGMDGYGNVGNGMGASPTVNDVVNAPASVLNVTGQVQLGVSSAAPYSYSPCILQDGGVQCWGSNTFQPLGNGSLNSMQYEPGTKAVGLEVNARSVSSGQQFACAISRAGALFCWGTNGRGQLGLGDTLQRNTPVSVPLMGSGVTKVQAGYETTFALKDGQLYSWGRESQGLLARGSVVADTPSPGLTVLEGGGVSEIASGSMAQTTCAIVGGRLKCWGNNGSFSLLGDGTVASRLAAVANTALVSTASILGVSVGSAHACAIVDGGIRCWGDNTFGQLGNGTTTSTSIPQEAGIMGGGLQVAVGTGFTCAIRNSRTECWGKNSSGQLGDGTNTDRDVPTTVSGLSLIEARKIGAGDEFACGLFRSLIQCWGKNSAGQLGDGSTLDSNVPVSVLSAPAIPLGVGLTDLAVGAGHACAIRDGQVWCWGANAFGQLGDGTTTQRSYAVRLLEVIAGTPTAGTQATAVALGRNHGCLLKNGGVKCWGRNASGQLGDGTLTDRTSAVDVVGLTSGVEAITAGDSHTCAFTRGSVRCWGAGGVLGDRTTTLRTSPVIVHDL
jgi:alpha-tubulin suppressor-like RCC1 family protein